LPTIDLPRTLDGIEALLALELQELSVELNFDVTVTGFETAEIDLLISERNEDSPDEADEVPSH
jgi:hypothetical protein